ncbi:L-threonine ammonia-lyase [Engraulis encrasicolus]|uniref:L-threonine ammonia-lyase n=1 Tax=Engraulis encrasicolus TaxID=184585 RepID=UPI002FCEE628
MSPERLKDFGAEEYLDHSIITAVETTETKEAPERHQCGSKTPETKRTPNSIKPKKKCASDSPCSSITTTPPPEYLTLENINMAAFQIQSGIPKTPCTYSRMSKQCGMELFMKKEHLNYTGSVKERGALHLLLSMTSEQQKKGVIVATDCNFSLAIAHHASELRIPAFVIMPANSSQSRLRMYREYSAMVISYGGTAHESKCHAHYLAKENGYLCLEEDDCAVYLAGLGTVGMEIYEQVPRLDAVIIPAGGICGLLTSAAVAIKHLNPNIAVIGVEPEEFPLLFQSLKTDSPVQNLHGNHNKKLYRDLVHHSMGTDTFHLAKKFVNKVVSVREDDALVAMLRFQECERSILDLEGALGVAAVTADLLPELKGKRVAIVTSSSNMELDLVRHCVDRALILDNRVSRFAVHVTDWPGEMAKLLDMLAREDIRLLDICHRRYNDRADLAKTKVECVIETRDKTQTSQLKRTLAERYPTLSWLDR